jgi:putative transposase
MLPGNPGHLESFDYLGLVRYSLTFCTDARADHFTVHSHIEVALEQIVRAATDEQFVIAAYCFMPDHLHLLVEGLTDGADARAFIRRAKQFSGFYFKKAHGKRLWQRYGYERVLRNDESTLSAARYILENPVRAGLVTRVEDYPGVGSRTHPISDILAAVQMMPITRKSR